VETGLSIPKMISCFKKNIVVLALKSWVVTVGIRALDLDPDDY
jgi:hypothetical protein